MKKSIIIICVVIAVSIGGYALYRSLFSSKTYGAVNVNIGGVDENAVPKMCQIPSGHPRIVCLADELKKTLDSGLLSKLQRPYAVTDAQKWSNFPPAGYRNRVGTTLDKFTKEQLAIVKGIIKEAAGTTLNEGYDEIEQILNADDFLKTNNKGAEGGFSSGNYHLAFLGAPSNTGTWQLYFGGHHLAVGFTYKDGETAGVTPAFRGVDPFETFEQNGRENMPMKQEQEAFSAMLRSLDENEKNTAELSQAFADIIAGPQMDSNFPSLPSGIRVGDLSKEKQALVIKVIKTYVDDIADRDFQVIMEKYKTELSDTYIAYSGTTGLNTINDYVRIDGPSIWIEISMQEAASGNGVHPHSIWRDKRTDYGGN